MNADLYAWLVDVQRADEVRRFVVVGASVVEAARHAQEAIAAAEGAESRLVGIELLAPALLGAVAVEAASPPPQVNESQLSAPAGMSRGEQLVGFLRDRGGRAHLHEIAEGLSTSLANAQNVIAAAVKKGLAEREGQRTGIVVLVDAPMEPTPTRAPPVPARSAARPSRAEQVVEVLRRHGGEVHASVIAEELSTDALNARNCVASAVKSGLAERVGNRSGRVRLVEEAPAEVTPKGPAATVPNPEELTGILRRVYDAMAELGAPATAQEIAEMLGCRPREAGNAATLLAVRGLTVKSRGRCDRSTLSPERPHDCTEAPRGVGVVACPALAAVRPSHTRWRSCGKGIPTNVQSLRQDVALAGIAGATDRAGRKVEQLPGLRPMLQSLGAAPGEAERRSEPV